jgi:hypothetical protein
MLLLEEVLPEIQNGPLDRATWLKCRPEVDIDLLVSWTRWVRHMDWVN